MSTFAIVFLCIQACLVQNVFSQQCLGAYGSSAFAPSAASFGYGNGYAELAYPSNGYAGAYPAASYGAAYGGVGEGNVAVTGELPVAGNTAVAGQVPIMGAVSFGGNVPAAGAVSVNGQCACGCGSPYYY